MRMWRCFSSSAEQGNYQDLGRTKVIKYGICGYSIF